MKILKAIGNFAVDKVEHVVMLVWLGLFLWASIDFTQDRSLTNGVRMIIWALVLFSQLLHMNHLENRANQERIFWQLAKLRHPANREVILEMSGSPIISRRLGERLVSRDDINADLKQQFGIPFPKSGNIPQPFFEPISTDPRMTAKVTGEFPLTDEEWRNKIEEERKNYSCAKDSGYAVEHEPAIKVSDGVSTDPKLAEELNSGVKFPEFKATIDDEVREPFAWGPADMGKLHPVQSYDMNDYSPDSPHYGKPHEDCCK